jgi:hypothetical protein
MKSLDENFGIESDGQFYLFKEYFDKYDLEVVFPRFIMYCLIG